MAGHRGESQDLRPRLAETLVRWYVQQAVTGHDSQFARPAQPVVLAVLVTFQVHELGSFHSADNEPFGGLVPIASVMVFGTAQR